MFGSFHRVGRSLAAAGAALVLATAVQADGIRDAMATAYENSQLLDQQRFLLRIDDENVTQNIASLFPVINFVANTARDFDNNTTTATASLVGQLVLYQGNRRRVGIEAARQTVNATRQQLISVEQQVLLDAVTAYLNVWEALQVVGVREQNVRVLSQQLRAARDRFEVGEDTRTDVAQAEAQLAQARAALAADQGTLEIARELYALAVGERPGTLAGPGGLPHLPSDAHEAERIARDVNPSIRAIQFEVSAAELAVEDARGLNRPTISLETRFDQTIDSPFPGSEGGSGSIALSLTQPIYQGGTNASIERQALAQASATRSGLNQQVLITVQQIGNAYALLQVANAQIQASLQQIEAAELAFLGVQEEASLGARTTLDVLDAEQDLLDARILRIAAQADLYLAAYQVLSATGLLTVEQLGLPVPEYDPEAYSQAFPAGQPRVASPQGNRLDSLLQRIGRD